LGLEGYRAIMKQCRREEMQMPVVAIGGIRLADAAALLAAGVHGIAFSGMLVHAGDPAAVVSVLKNTLSC
jgi:thiamine-phosphate pyrophosphorylase